MRKKICLLILAGLLAAASSALLLLTIGLQVSGYHFFNVMTVSMYPAIRLGDMIAVQPCAPEEINEGDVITVNISNDGTGQLLVTHRVTGILAEHGGEQGLWFVTKGDSNPSPDPPVEAERLIGKVVFRLPGLGQIMQEHAVVSALIILFPSLLSYGATATLVLLAVRWQEKSAEAKIFN